jgi:hypothetical protein
MSGAATGMQNCCSRAEWIRGVLQRARPGCSGAVAGIASPTTAVRRSAAGARLTPGATAWAFVCSAVPSSKVAGGVNRPAERSPERRPAARDERRGWSGERSAGLSGSHHLPRSQPASRLRRQPELCQQAAGVVIRMAVQ